VSDERAQGGSRSGFENLSAYEPALRRYLRKRVAAVEVDDLVQEVFASLYARRADTVVDDVERYIFTVAGNALNRKRIRDRRTGLLEDEQSWETTEEPTPERILLCRERLGSAVAVISNLPPRTRQVFVLHRFEEMTYRRIGEELGISVSAVEKHIMYALRALIGDQERSL